MSLRNLVTGRDACAPSEANRRSNVIGNLANTLLERAQASDRARNVLDDISKRLIESGCRKELRPRIC